MFTYYEEVFKAFLNRVIDPFYGEICEDLSEDDMIGLMDDAILNFEFPRVDLTKKDDELRRFEEKLNFYVVQILGALMALSWLRRQLFDIDLVKQTMSPLEFQRYSQANHLSSLEKLLERNEAYVDSLKKKYSRREGTSSLFNRLGG